MAKRKEQAVARKGTVSKRGKARTKKSAPLPETQPSTPARRRGSRKQRTVIVKTKAKKLGIKPRARQAARKKVGPRPIEPSRQAAEADGQKYVGVVVTR